MNMIDDIATWSTVFVLTLVGFALTLSGLERIGWYGAPGDPVDVFGVHGSFWVPAWAMYGVLDISDYQAFTASLTPWLMWLYMLVSSVVMVNLLVAMFAETYSRVSEQALSEYRFQECARVFRYRYIASKAPPPFNLPWCLFELIGVNCGFYKLRSKPAPPQTEVSDGSQARLQYTKAAAEAEAAQVDKMVLSLQAGINRLDQRWNSLVGRHTMA